MFKVRSGLCPALRDGWAPRVWLSGEVAPGEALPASNGFPNALPASTHTHFSWCKPFPPRLPLWTILLQLSMQED